MHYDYSMRWMLLLLLALLPATAAAVDVGEAAPDFEFEQAWNVGNESSLSAFRGNVVVLEYWATW